MGNCLNFVSSNVKSENARVSDNASNHPSRATAKPHISTAPATVAARLTNPTLSIPSHTQGSSSGSLPTPRTEGEILSSRGLKAFTFNELKTATRNFRPDSLVGEGGFGYVFKGWIDSQTFTASKPGLGMVVAVKKLKPEGSQGHKEWLTEVDYLGQLHHPNLVKLIGYCLDGDHRLLVYEFMPRGSLENHLFRRGPQPLSWATRIKVAITAAKGLAFLHDPERQVIYRDVKASNILLDLEFNAKLSDFGLAKAGPTGDKTHVSTRVIGTQGYAAPEYIATGRLSAKADIYSFGVVLLELLSGRPAFDSSKPSTEQNLVDWAKPFLGDKRKLFRIMDSKLEGQYPKKVAYALAILTLQCISNDPRQRPHMSEVLPVLEQLQDPKNADKILQNVRVKSITGKKSPMGHNALPHWSAPRSSSLQQTPDASPLQRTPPRSPIQQTPGGSPLRQTPGGSPFRQTPGGSPLWQTPGGSPLRQTPSGSPLRQTPGGSPLPSNRQSPSMH